jgi:4-oxalocrotonate tautomerase
MTRICTDQINGSEQQKLQLTEAIVKDVMTFARVGDNAVSVSVEEIGPSDWVDKVYRPDILNGPGKLYEEPDTIRSISAGVAEKNEGDRL